VTEAESHREVYKEGGSGCKPEARIRKIQAIQSSSCNPHQFHRIQGAVTSDNCRPDKSLMLANSISYLLIQIQVTFKTDETGVPLLSSSREPINGLKFMSN